MSAHALLNLLNELGEKIRYEVLPSILTVFPNEFNKAKNTSARVQDSIYHMTQKSHLVSDFRTKERQDSTISKRDVVMNVIA